MYKSILKIIMKKLKAAIPSIIRNKLRRLSLSLIEYRSARLSTEEVFTEIYKRNRWGGRFGELNSGTGSSEEYAAPYVEMLYKQAALEGFTGRTFVDLGCGDFRVGQRIVDLASRYVAVDIVNSVVQTNRRLYDSDKIEFVHSDIILDDLPQGDVCMIRQVLQHLSNDQIMVILSKVNIYRWVFITEHYPSGGEARINLDKQQGAGTRVDAGSGVYLTESPFNLRSSDLTELLSIPLRSGPSGCDSGVVKTFLYKPREIWNSEM